jgi:hypothetical protein
MPNTEGFIVNVPVSIGHNRDLVPRAEPYTAADLEGCNVQWLMDSGAIVPTSHAMTRQVLINTDTADPETLKEEIRRLQAQLTGQNPAVMDDNPAVHDTRHPVRRIGGPRLQSTADIRNVPGLMDSPTQGLKDSHSPMTEQQYGEIISRLDGLTDSVATLLLLARDGKEQSADTDKPTADDKTQ